MISRGRLLPFSQVLVNVLVSMLCCVTAITAITRSNNLFKKNVVGSFSWHHLPPISRDRKGQIREKRSTGRRCGPKQRHHRRYNEIGKLVVCSGKCWGWGHVLLYRKTNKHLYILVRELKLWKDNYRSGTPQRRQVLWRNECISPHHQALLQTDWPSRKNT